MTLMNNRIKKFKNFLITRLETKQKKIFNLI
jgi:hypothetical protein